MKKFLPALAISFVFTALMISQLVINGQELAASQTEKDKSQFSLFENQFTKLKTVSSKGTDINLEEVKEPIVILNFWASWCRPCIAEFKTLNSLIRKFPKMVKVVGINNDTEDAKKLINKIETKHELLFDSIVDMKGDYADRFKVMSVPASIVFYKGKVIKFIKKEYDFVSEEFLELVKSKID